MSRARSIEALGHRKIAAIALEGVYPGSLTAVIDVLEILNRHMRNRIRQTQPESPPMQGVFTPRLLALGGDHVTSVGKLRIAVDGDVATSREKFDVVYLPAFDLGRTPGRRLAALADVAPWLRRQHQRGAVLAAHGSGIFLLAEAGLLDGHVASIPIALAKEFRRRYPNVRLDMTQSIVIDRETACAAALADGMRLLWRVLQKFRPGMLSLQTGLDLFFHDTGRRIDTTSAEVENVGDPLIDATKHALHDWLINNISGSPDMAQLARELATSERTLFRRFKAATGMTPRAYLQRLRMEMAEGWLSMSELSIDRIAARVGYGNRAYFTRLFRGHSGLTPRAFRAHSRK